MVKMIEFKKVSFKYGNKIILNEVDISIPQGKTEVILGSSGTGKSTLLKIMVGLISPDSGKVYFDEKSLFDLNEKELLTLRRRLAMVFQNGGLFDSLNVAENVSYRCQRCDNLSPQEIEGRIEKELSYVGLKGTEKLIPSQLSAGMRKRVGIARALCTQAKIILFDEPTVGLDPLNTYNIQRILAKLKKERAVTMVIVTHDIDNALEIADEVVILNKGRFIFKGTPDELKKSQDEQVQAFLNPKDSLWEEFELSSD